MLLSRLTLTEAAIRRPEVWRALADDYAVHRQVWSLFGDRADRRRDFLFRFDRDGDRGRRVPVLWTLSERAPRADPHHWTAEHKAISPRLEKGDRLAFQVRVNPVVKRAGQRHDVVMDAKKQRPDDDPRTGGELLREAARDWFARRAPGWGVEAVALRVDGYRISRFARARGQQVSLGLCELSGVLRVVEPESFLRCWSNGFGPAKGFGCGLMLLARARGSRR